MATVIIPELSLGDVASKVREVLESWPLYRIFKYRAASEVQSLPPLISLHCDNCNKQLLWENLDTSENYGQWDRQYKGFLPKRRYVCRNCRHETVYYYLWWGEIEENVSAFYKVGQYPPLEERVPKELELSGEDLVFYKQGLRCRNFGYGLAAVAYLRRVIENRMDDMLDLIATEAKNSGFAEEQLQQLESVKAGKRFSDKVGYAMGILPPHLRPGGHNPIERLHEITSDGVHAKSDDECVDIFDRSRFVFEYTFKKLQIDAAEARAFAEELVKLTQPKDAGSK